MTANGPNTAATITAHHLLYNRSDIFQAGKVHPHLFCLPILKRERHRVALVQAATSGSRQFFLGTDSAPHPVSAKECACGCAGIFTAHAAVPLYVQVFERAGALHHFNAFASQHGADFYGAFLSFDGVLCITNVDVGGKVFREALGAACVWSRTPGMCLPPTNLESTTWCDRYAQAKSCSGR